MFAWHLNWALFKFWTYILSSYIFFLVYSCAKPYAQFLCLPTQYFKRPAGQHKCSPTVSRFIFSLFLKPEDWDWDHLTPVPSSSKMNLIVWKWQTLLQVMFFFFVLLFSLGDLNLFFGTCSLPSISLRQFSITKFSHKCGSLKTLTVNLTVCAKTRYLRTSLHGFSLFFPNLILAHFWN